MQGITLTGIDEEVLNTEMISFMGNINLKTQKVVSLTQWMAFEISLRLLTLLNMCIMKMAGYMGHIINHVKTQEKGLGKTINEDYYRII